MSQNVFTKKSMYKSMIVFGLDVLMASLITETIFTHKDQEIPAVMEVISGQDTKVLRIEIDRELVASEAFVELIGCPDHLVSCQYSEGRAYINCYCGEIDEDSFVELSQFASKTNQVGVTALANAIRHYAEVDYSHLAMAA